MKSLLLGFSVDDFLDPERHILETVLDGRPHVLFECQVCGSSLGDEAHVMLAFCLLLTCELLLGKLQVFLEQTFVEVPSEFELLDSFSCELRLEMFAAFEMSSCSVFFDDCTLGGDDLVDP